MVPVSVSSASIGAPQLNGDPGSLFHVLRFALPQLGWTEAFVDVNRFRVAFRNDPAAGTGHYLEIVDHPDEHGQGPEQVRMLGYQSMSDVGIGVGQFPDNAWIAKSLTGGSDQKPWRIFGDSRSFWLMFNPNTQTTRPCFWYFGDGRPFRSTDQALFLVTGVDSAQTTALTQHSIFRNLSQLETVEAAQDFGLTQVGQPLEILNTPADGTSGTLLSGNMGDSPAVSIGGGIINAPIVLQENNRYRGMLRGAFVILVNVESTVNQGFIPTGHAFDDVQTFLGPRDLELIKLNSWPNQAGQGGTLLSLAFDTAADWDDWN